MTPKEKSKRDEFRLRIAGISLGNHKFSITCDELFFEISNISELQGGCLQLQIDMENQEKMLNLHFHIQGNVVAPCDRCLDPVEIPLEFTEQLVVKLVEQPDESLNEDNLWFIDENEYALDVFHFVYEIIRLALPIKITHPDDEQGNSTCNPEILKILENLSLKESQIDPRWEALKQIKQD